MGLFTKSNFEVVTKLIRYSDASEMQVCFNKWNKTCEIYRALPDVKNGSRFMRNTKFHFDFHHLLPLVDVLSRVSDDELKYVVVVEKDKRLVLCKNEEFGNWNLGYESKRKVADVEPLVADLDAIEDNDLEIITRSDSPEISGFDEMDKFKRFTFQKRDLLVSISEKLLVFRITLLDIYPELRRDSKVCNVENFLLKWNEDYLKKNLNLFN